MLIQPPDCTTIEKGYLFLPFAGVLSKFRVAHLIVADLATDWFHKLKVTGLNNSKTIADSPSIVNSKIIPKHTTYLILILVFEKYYFYTGF